jgi:threonine aldolase
MRSARRYRKMLGGGMRQAGIIAAGALYALEHHVARLAEDHAKARRMAEVLAAAGVRVVPPETNIVMMELPAEGPDADTLVARARERGLLLASMGARRLRAVTHLDVEAAACERASAILTELLTRP